MNRVDSEQPEQGTHTTPSAPGDDPTSRQRTREARAARRRTPLVWLVLAATIAAVFLVAFVLAAIL